ncbi:mutator type transposase [Tanacetum coccineum]|uniref:Mutator type transposase n=1 Tax=Tanacetum coccineum TaxID=301880 RepID=A0ABQ4ZZ31_9ASTR
MRDMLFVKNLQVQLDVCSPILFHLLFGEAGCFALLSASRCASCGYVQRKPDGDLDTGMHALGNDHDVRKLAEYVRLGNKMTGVYIEHERTTLHTYYMTHEDADFSTPKCVIEEIKDDAMPEIRVTKLKPRKPLVGKEIGESTQPASQIMTQPSVFVDPFYSASYPFLSDNDFDPFLDLASLDVIDKEIPPSVGNGKVVLETIEEEGSGSKSSDDGNDNDELVDVENPMEHVDIGVIDNDEFESASKEDGLERVRQRKLKQLKKQHKPKNGVCTNTTSMLANGLGVEMRNYVMELKAYNPNITVRNGVKSEAYHTCPTIIFKRIYVCLGATKGGFKACMRDFLGFDGAFMKGPFPGQLLTVVGVDPNNGIYPLAYSILESESRDSWTWFLEHLKEDLELQDNSNFTFIGDRQKGIIHAIAALFPAAKHRFCLRHIHEKLRWAGTAYKDLLWKCATALTIPQFQEVMDLLKGFNKDCYDWLWRSKTDMLLNNMCEVLNGQMLDGRDMPFISTLEYAREYMMKRIMIVKHVIEKSVRPLTPTATRLFQAIKDEVSEYTAN